MGISRGQFIKLERDERGLTIRTVGLAAKAFGVPRSEISDEFGPVGGSGPTEEALGARDLKLYAAVEGGPGEMVISTDPNRDPAPAMVRQECQGRLCRPRCRRINDRQIRAGGCGYRQPAGASHPGQGGDSRAGRGAGRVHRLAQDPSELDRHTLALEAVEPRERIHLDQAGLAEGSASRRQLLRSLVDALAGRPCCRRRARRGQRVNDLRRLNQARHEQLLRALTWVLLLQALTGAVRTGVDDIAVDIAAPMHLDAAESEAGPVAR